MSKQNPSQTQVSDSPSDLRDLALLLRTIRRASGLTQKDLAIVCGLSQKAIAQIESGEIDLRVSSLFKILKHTGRRLTIEPYG